MISNFVAEQDPAHSRCAGGRLLHAPKETISHIFFDCPMIANILSKLNNLISNNTLDLVELTNVFWLGVPEKKINCIFKMSLIVMATKYHCSLHVNILNLLLLQPPDRTRNKLKTLKMADCLGSFFFVKEFVIF